jgi:hypothetical protein
MGRKVLFGAVFVLILAVEALGQRNTIVTGKFQSFKDGVLTIKDLRGDKDREFKLDSDTSVVSMSNTKEKLRLTTAFDGVEVGRTIRVYLKGKGDDGQVEAVQIGVGATGGRGERPRPGAGPRHGHHMGLIPTARGTGNHFDRNGQRLLESVRRVLVRFAVSFAESFVGPCARAVRCRSYV